MKLIDSESLDNFFYSETSGTEEMIENTVMEFPNMEMEYPDDCRDLCKKVIEMCRNVIRTEPVIFDEDSDKEGMQEYAIWQDHEVIGYVKLSEDTAKTLNRVQNECYFGFDEKTNPEKYKEGNNETV